MDVLLVTETGGSSGQRRVLVVMKRRPGDPQSLVRALPHPGGRILWSFWEPESTLRQKLNKDTNTLYTLYTGARMSFVELLAHGGPRHGRMEGGSVSCFWGNRHRESATENCIEYWGYWVIHTNMRSVGSDEIRHILILTSISCYMLVTSMPMFSIKIKKFIRTNHSHKKGLVVRG